MAQKTALFGKHVSLGGKIVDFAGFELPVQYEKGILHEHAVVRQGVGVFDVSHMGEFFATGDNVVAALQHLMTNRIDTMQNGQCRYSLMCNADGGVVDDVLLYRLSENFFVIVVNAANIEKDFAHVQANLLPGAAVSNESGWISEIAVQGPLAKKVIERMFEEKDIPQKRYRFTPNIRYEDTICWLSTTGYTGEDGYEIYAANENIGEVYDILMETGAEFGIEPIGLGARDTLRFESSMPLYGHELSESYNAAECGLDAFIKLDCDFLGRDAVAACKREYARRGIKLTDKGIAREHCDLYGENGEKIGVTTSGGVCPTLGGSYAMVRVKSDYPESSPVYVDVRGRRLAAVFTPLPFYHKA